MACMGIILNGCTDIHIFTSKTMNLRKYRDQVLYPYDKLLVCKT